MQFHQWLKDYKAGVVDDQLTAALAEVSQAVVTHSRKGVVKLTISLTEQGGGVVVEADVAHTAPEAKPAGQFFYVTPHGALSRRDPQQPQLPTMEDTTND